MHMLAYVENPPAIWARWDGERETETETEREEEVYGSLWIGILLMLSCIEQDVQSTYLPGID